MTIQEAIEAVKGQHMWIRPIVGGDKWLYRAIQVYTNSNTDGYILRVMPLEHVPQISSNQNLFMPWAEEILAEWELVNPMDILIKTEMA